MEENKKVRNHISIILENAGGLGFMFLFVVVPMIIETDFRQDVLEQPKMFLGFSLGMLVFLVFMMGGPIINWARTFISIQNNALVIERKTIRREVNTIGIQHISNVNLEQNLIERLLGTCKVKLNTDSLSTADKTDVKIVLKKKDAEALKKQILRIMNQNEDVIFAEAEGFESTDVGDGLTKMLIHGSLSISIVSILVAISCLWGVFDAFQELWIEGISEESISMAMSSMVILGFVGFSAVWSVIGGFIKYYNFKVERVKDKIYIQYGLLKKVNYTIPVERINGLRLAQSPQARIAKYYRAEILNVGLNDEEEENESFLLLYDKKEKIESEIRRLLPEFAEELELSVEKQSKAVWAIWSIPFTIFLFVVGGVNAFVAEMWMEELKWSVMLSAAVVFVVLVHLVGQYKTEGALIKDKLLVVCAGSFKREFVFLKYDKIQYLEANQNVAAKYLGQTKINAYLLAAGMDKIQNTSYLSDEKLEILKEKILNRK